MHVTYTEKNLSGTRSRFAVECETKEQAYEVAYDLNSKACVSNVRITTCGKGLPDQKHTYRAPQP